MRPLTERDLEMLNDMVYSYFESTGPSRGQGMAPLEFGGSNNSYHGRTALKLVGHGFVEAKKRGKDWGDTMTRDARGSNVYRPTEAGRKAVIAWRSIKQAAEPKMVKKWGHMIPNTNHRSFTAGEIAELRLKCHLDMPA